MRLLILLDFGDRCIVRVLSFLVLKTHYGKIMSFSKLNITDIDNITDEYWSEISLNSHLSAILSQKLTFYQFNKLTLKFMLAILAFSKWR